MGWNDICRLGKSVTAKDKIGSVVKKVKFNAIYTFCNVKSIRRNEFYMAAQAGFRPTMTIEVNRYEYDGHEYAEYNKKIYKIIRTYKQSQDVMELTLEEKLNPPEVVYG